MTAASGKHREAVNLLLGLLKPERRRESTRQQRDELMAAESDKGRIINHPAFRRLLGKAQVFPLEPNAAVRTRLTHSIEVAQVGRHIAYEVVERLVPTDVSNEEFRKWIAFASFVEAACLLHDIGNPAFGHFGEMAVREWFKDYSKEKGFEEELEEICHFDGNPQGFRLISFLGGKDEFGLNLTYTLLLSALKYPWDIEGASSEKKEKFGMFASDSEAYREACRRLGWKEGRLFPLAVLMEAADDIAYSMSDVEDGIEKGLLTVEEIKSAIREEVGQAAVQRYFGRQRAIDELVYFRSSIFKEAAECVAENFCKNLSYLVEWGVRDQGERRRLLLGASEVGDALKVVRRLANQKVYCSESAERIELAGKSAICGLLSHFRVLLDMSESDFRALVGRVLKAVDGGRGTHEYETRLLRRIPVSYIRKYDARLGRGEAEIRLRAQLIVDYLAGMTDNFALEMYQVINGIRI